MLFWEGLWTLLWFGGLGLFTVLAVVITVQGGRDLQALLHGLHGETVPGGEPAGSTRRG